MGTELTAVERAFLERWREMDFSSFNEPAVREEFIIRLLHVLGYRKGTTFDIEMEKELRLSAPYHRIGRKKVAIDYAPSIRMRHFWIIEAKPGTQRRLSFGDVLQAHLYAIHPDVQARYVVLCNGWEVRVYDAITLKSADDILVVCKQDDCLTSFPELRAILAAENMLTFERDRLVSLLEKTIEVEIDLDKFNALRGKLLALLQGGERQVKKNAQDHQFKYFARWTAARERDLRASSIEELLVMMDLPEDTMRPPSDEYVRRVLEADAEQRVTLIEELFLTTLGRPHNVLRGRAVYVLACLLEQDISIAPSPAQHVRSITDTLNHVGASNLRYWSHIHTALCHLDNVAMRVAYKLCTRLGSKYLDALKSEGSKLMSTEDRIGWQPSLATLMGPSVAHAQEILWRKYCRENEGAIWAGVWTLQAAEKELDAIPAFSYPRGEGDQLFFEHQGKTICQLRAMTWNALRGRTDVLRARGLSDELASFASLSWDDVRAGIPPEPQAPPTFQATVRLDDLATHILPAVLRVRTLSFLEQATRGTHQ
jgi:hypothetical protein